MPKKKGLEATQGIRNVFDSLFPENFYLMDLLKYFLLISFLSLSNRGFFLLDIFEGAFELYMISFVFLVSILIAGVIFTRLKTGYFHLGSAICFGAIVDIQFLAYSLLFVVICVAIHLIKIGFMRKR